LQKQKKDFLSQGILVNKFDLITHSMGGLVARYYSASQNYLKNDDINKIIFLSVASQRLGFGINRRGIFQRQIY